jgi:hypothetical protein
MRRGQHLCSVPSCENFCPKQYPLCAPCWRKVPREERAEVVKELARCGGDPGSLRFAIAAATESVRVLAGSKTRTAPGWWFWEMAYLEAGAPEL